MKKFLLLLFSIFYFQDNVIAVEKDSVCTQIQNCFNYMFIQRKDSKKEIQEIHILEQNQEEIKVYEAQEKYDMQSQRNYYNVQRQRNYHDQKLSFKNIAVVKLSKKKFGNTSPNSVATKNITDF